MYGQTSKPLTFGFGASTNTQTSAIPSFSGWTSTTTSNTALQSSVFRSAGSTSKPGGLFGASTTGVGLGGLGAFGGQSQGSLSTGFTLGGSKPPHLSTGLGGGLGGQSGFSSSLYSSQAPTGSGFTLGGQLGGITATQQVTGLESITRATKFIDLPEDVKKHLLNVENYIEQQKKVSGTIKTTSLPDAKARHEEIAKQVHQVTTKVIRLRNHLETDERVVKDLLQNFERQRAYMDHAVRVSEFMEKDDRYHQVSGNGALKYFQDLITSLKERLDQYNEYIQELERHMSAVTQAENEQALKNAISDTLRFQHDSFMVVTGKIASLHEAVDQLRKEYLEYRRIRFGDTHNPFIDKSWKRGNRMTRAFN
ncbi:8550_t:CDS:2 [Paraglomus brasilianum]|uniref:8550_t:CDS:1 n=1 Tax=Paraglomus brasilianum TaxID=144538 RepID=A0A9N9AY40_9GLOM|nr:8550_t:CDS:2 [Paraglomus brasilianum]